MLAATDLLVFAFQVPFAVRRPALHSSACRRTQVPHASISLATTMSVAEDLAGLESAVVTDTLLDIAVYLLLAGVAGLTLYSLVVTLQKSNEEYGGWTPKDDEAVAGGDLANSGGFKKGAVYDPTTDQWTYPSADEAATRVGRAPAQGTAAGGADDGTNRYDRRMAKKRKKAQKRNK